MSVHRKPRAIRRRRSLRKRLIRVLIVGEGRETERNYFDALKREDSVTVRFHVTVKKGKGGTREQIARHAVDCKNEDPEDYDHVFCVMDVEKQSHAKSLGKALTLLRNNGIIACLSNPSFEIWLNAHFERTSAAFLSANSALLRLNGNWKKHFGCDYAKSDASHHSRLMTRRPNALRNAKDVRETDHGRAKSIVPCNSATDVYRLVGWLLGKRQRW